MNISQLSALTKLVSANPSELKTIIKLASIDVLKSLGDNKYSVMLGDKTLTAQSDKPIEQGAKYWVQLTDTKDVGVKLSNLIKMPKLFQSLHSSPLKYSLEDLKNILEAKTPASTLKHTLFEHLASAKTQDDFTNLSALLLSLQNQTLTIPIEYKNYFSILQMKKRYNKSSKKAQVDFYAALELLGPVSGILTLEDNEVFVNLNVAFEKTKEFLQNDMNNFSHTLSISLVQDIEPLYELKTINSLLDVSI